MGKLYFQTKSTEKIGLYVENNKVEAIQIDRPTLSMSVGSIYVGKVRNVDKKMEAAFVELENGIVGFLPQKEYPFITNTTSIHTVLTNGMTILVQVIKEAYQDKGPRLSCNITIGGDSIVYLPYGEYIAVSKKIKEQKEEYEQFFTQLLLEKEGVIVRTNSVNKSKATLHQELGELRQTFQHLKQQSDSIKKPTLLYRKDIIPTKMMNQYRSVPIEEIIFDQYSTMKQMEKIYPEWKAIMQVREKLPLMEGKTIDQLLQASLDKTIQTTEGITLTIDETEALTVIDIDSSKFKSNQSKQLTLLQINIQAIQTICREIQKRNISGIIVIDFLKMKDEKERQIVVNQLQERCKRDPIRTEIFGFTKLGLLEMTRKREQISLLQLMSDSSLSNHISLNVQSVAYRLEREMLEYGDSKAEACCIRTSKQIAEFTSMLVKNKRIDLEVYVLIDSSKNTYITERVGTKEMVMEYIDTQQHFVIDKLV